MKPTYRIQINDGASLSPLTESESDFYRTASKLSKPIIFAAAGICLPKKQESSVRAKENSSKAKFEMEDAAIEEVCKTATVEIPSGMIETRD